MRDCTQVIAVGKPRDCPIFVLENRACPRGASHLPDNSAVNLPLFPPDSPRTPAPTRTERDVYSVSRLNKEVRLLLESGLPLLWLEGELSNFAAPASGHWYFSLKDSAAQVRCAMWRQRNTQVRFRPKDGMAVLVRARVGPV